MNSAISTGWTMRSRLQWRPWWWHRHSQQHLQLTSSAELLQSVDIITQAVFWQAHSKIQIKASEHQISHYLSPSGAHCCHMGTAVNHSVPGRVKPSFVIFVIRVVHSALSIRVPRRQKYEWWLNLVWHRMIYSCTNTATVGIKLIVCLWPSFAVYKLNDSEWCSAGLVSKLKLETAYFAAKWNQFDRV